MYRKKLMRVALAGIMTATVVTSSMPVRAAEPVAAKQEETAENKEAKKATLKVTYALEGSGKQVATETVTSPGVGSTSDKWTFVYGEDFKVPAGYELSDKQDMSLVNMSVKFGGEGRLVILVKEVPQAKKATLKVTYALEGSGKQVATETVTSPGVGSTSDKWTFVYGEDFKVPAGYELSDKQDMSLVNMSVKFGGEGRLVILVKEVPQAKKATLKVTYALEGSGKQVATETVTSPGVGSTSDKWTFVYGEDFKVPAGYELSDKQDMSLVNMSVKFGGEGQLLILVKEVKPVESTVEVTFIDEETKAPVGEKVNVEVKDGMINTGKLTAPEGYEVCEKGDVKVEAGSGLNVEVRKVAAKTVEVTFIDEETKAPVGEKVEVEVKDGMINTGKLTAPNGYEVCEKGDVKVEAGSGLNVEVRKVVRETVLHVTFETTDGEVVGTDTAVEASVGAEGECWTFMLGKDFELPEGYVLTADPAYANQVVNVELPFGSAGGHTIVVDKVAAKTVEVTFIDEETKAPVGEKVEVEVKDGKINTTELTAPEGYEVCEKGDVAATAGAGLNVEVRKTEKTVYVSYIDEATKKPFENGIEEIKVASDAKAFNTSVLKKVPAGYELCVVGDVALNGDTVNVEVRKVPAKTQTVVVRFLENGKEVGLTTIEIEGNIFNTSILTAPEGYEIATLGDVQAQDGVAEVEVRKVSAKESIVKVQFVDADTDKVVAGGDYFVDADGDGIFNHSEVEKWVPEGYKLAEFGDFNVENYKETPLQLSVVKEKAEIPWTDLEDAKPVEKPETPVKPEKPGTQNQNTDKEENKKEDNKKKEDKKKAPKTSDEANPLAAAVPAGLSLAAILALLVKKFK